MHTKAGRQAGPAQRSAAAHMSDLRPICFCGRMIWAECTLSVLGMGWLMMHTQRTTCATFLTLVGK
jgi:hypothetical protein